MPWVLIPSVRRACRRDHLGIYIVASAFTHTTQLGATAVRSRVPTDAFVIPDLLSCLVLSWSEQRSQLLQSVARDETWQAKVCGDVQEFLRSVFQSDVPLTIVDLPPRGSATYESLREMATQTCGLNRSLMVVCGSEGDPEEERWARQLGVWAYLPGASELGGLRMVFAEARKALAKKSSAYVESSGYR